MDEGLKNIIQTARGFMESRILLSAIELDIFTAIEGGKTAEEAAKSINGHPRSTATLLDALVSMGFLNKTEGVYMNTQDTARLLSDYSQESIRASMMHTVHLWESWHLLTESVKAGTSASMLKGIKPQGEAWREAFIAAMHRNASTMAKELAKAIELSSVERVLDIGGGSGAYSIELARAKEGLLATVLDLEEVTKIAERHIKAAGLEDRVKTFAADYNISDYGRGFDLVLLSAILHSNSSEENREILKKCFACLNSGGRVAIREFVLNDDKSGPRQAAVFSINMLVATKGGASYSGAEYRLWLEEAGFRNFERRDLDENSVLIIARKP